MESIKNQIAKLPPTPGIYKFFDSGGNLLYVGKSVSIKKRVKSYFASRDLGPRTSRLVQNIARVDYIKVFSEFEALLLESELIRTNSPFYNIIAKDDKSPLYIKITADEIPLIQTARKQNPKRGIFQKGPFPNTKTARGILKQLRRIFPYCIHKNPKKPCLYVHLGLCPYPYRNGAKKEEYLKTIAKVKKLLLGKSKSLTADLVREMKGLAKNQDYEGAAIVKKQIENLKFLQTAYHAPREFLERPTLVDDLTQVRLRELQKVLSLKKIPRRIECYDISNILGKLATGSMVVFTNGAADKSQYRRFRIKSSNTPDDYEMLREVLGRRIKNDWRRPDVIIIDGGRGQLNAALSIVNKYKYSTTVISLAKRQEEIYTFDKILPISLTKENPARQLAQEVRDEAHRFAISYHRKLRSKAFIKT